MSLSWVLNQDLAGAQKEQSFLKQLEHARLKWTDMGKPQLAQQSRHHSAEFKVKACTTSISLSIANYVCVNQRVVYLVHFIYLSYLENSRYFRLRLKVNRPTLEKKRGSRLKKMI